MNSPFVHLRLHSQYSLIDSLVDVKKLVKAVDKLGQRAVALTDQCNFFGALKFYKAAQSAGIKPIIGSDFYLLDDSGESHLLTLLAMDDTGYKNITEIISLAYLHGQKQGVAYIQRAYLEQYNEGVIALSGAKFGDIGKALLSGKKPLAEELLRSWMALYPNRFYIELQRTGRADDENYLHQAVALASQLQCPVVASNDVRFIEGDEASFEAHEARVCIHDASTIEDENRPRRYSPQQYLRSSEEMCELFSDIPSAISNTVEIAKRCNVNIHLGEYFLPEYPIPEGQTQEQFFRQIAQEGLAGRLQFLYPEVEQRQAVEAKYLERLKFELDIILQMGFPGYFLIVMDFIAWAKKQNIPVGPGRGSGAGSLVAYSLHITDLDPLAYDLLFERFLNPERVSMPDFDIDFCMDRRGEVIDYVSHQYGEMAVSQIATFGTMAAKAVIRDVARVQGKSYGLADKLAKMIPFEVGITLEKAFEQEEALQNFIKNDEAANEIWQMALRLEGTIRNVGKHAGGVVIAPNKLTDFSPIYCDEQGAGKVTQFDKSDVEEAGLVKFDFLGLRTLTIIDWAVQMINQTNAEKVDIARIALDDQSTFDLLKRAETTAVFQLESRGMKDLIKRLQPDNLEDLIALVALFRPGPLDSGMVDDFVNRKHGRAEVAYPDAKYQHEWLKPILAPTYGVIVYQEQVMQIAQVLAGYSLGGADMLRRAMGKKKPEEMAKQRSVFKQGAIDQGVDGDLAMQIFDLVEKFAGYGFNKSHSAAYALVSYQTAWLKTHYPAQFMAATMSSELQNTDKIVIFMDECQSMGQVVRNPDINEGQYYFSVNKNNEIIYGLGAIKGLGEGPIQAILEARKTYQSFSDLFDFCEKVDHHKINKRALEALIKAGAFDSLKTDRAILLEAMNDAMQSAEQQSQNQDAGMMDLFADISFEQSTDVYKNYRHISEFSLKQRLQAEKDSLGLFITGHPMDDYLAELRAIGCKNLAQLQADSKEQLLAGMISGLREVKTKRGDKLLILSLADKSASLDVTVFSKLLPEVKDKLVKDRLVFIRGKVEEDSYSGGLRVRAEAVLDLLEMRSQMQGQLCITVGDDNFNSSSKEMLESLLTQSDSGSQVLIQYSGDNLKAKLQLPKQWRISPDEDSIQQLKRVFGQDKVNFVLPG